MKTPWFAVKGVSPSGLIFLFFLLFGVSYYFLSVYTPMGSWLHTGRSTHSAVEAIINFIALPGALVCLGLVRLIELLAALFGGTLPADSFVYCWFAAQLLTALLAAGLVRYGIRCFRPRKPDLD